jgi:hypothetical protein
MEQVAVFATSRHRRRLIKSARDHICKSMRKNELPAISWAYKFGSQLPIEKNDVFAILVVSLLV